MQCKTRRNYSEPTRSEKFRIGYTDLVIYLLSSFYERTFNIIGLDTFRYHDSAPTFIPLKGTSEISVFGN